MNYLILVIVFISGFSTIVYQVVWERLLRINLGGDHVSSFIVTSVFLLGLGVGAFIFKGAKRNSVLIYAILECLIIGYAFFSYDIFSNGIALIGSLVDGGMDLGNHKYLVIASSMLLLLPPCIFIGASLPLALDITFKKGIYSVSRIGSVYGINTIGASIGAIVLPFLFFNHMDFPSTLRFVATVNFLAVILLLTLFLLRLKIDVSPSLETSEPSTLNIDKVLGSGSISKPRVSLPVVCFLSFLSGGVALSAELVFFRFADINLPASAYNFPIILGLFLLAMGMGSIFFTRLAKKRSYDEVFLAACLFFGSVLAMLWALWVQSISLGGVRIIEVVLKYLVMVAPFAFLQGGIFPFLIRMSSCSGDTVSESAGIIYLWNAIGAFFISFLTHFFLLSFYGVQGTILLLVTIGICGSLIALLYFRAKKIIYGLVASVIVVSISAMIPGDYWFRVGIDPEKDFDYFEGSTGLVTIEWDEDREAAVIKINGKENAFVPNHNGNTELAMLASSIKGDGAIIILGMGGGVIVEDLLRDDTIAKIDVIDWSNELPVLLKKYSSKIGLKEIFSTSRVKLYNSDARLMSSLLPASEYKLVVDNLVSSYMVGATNVRSFEYYKNIKRILHDDGVLLTSLHSLTSTDKHEILATISKSFGHMIVYKNTFAIAGLKPLRCSGKIANESNSSCLINAASI